jgi:signal transduction histidine kinase
MEGIKPKKQISRVILISFGLIAIISILVAGVFWFINVMNIYQEEITRLKSDYIDQQKSEAKLEVEDALEYIEYHRSKAETIAKQDIRERLYTAYDVASHIYQINRNNKTTAEIKELIKEVLRPIKFNQGRGYYFIVNMAGVGELFPDYPEYEGTNLLDLQDIKGNYVIRNELKVVKEQGEGFLINFWRKPGQTEGMIFPKVIFVKKFEPFNWYIGTGEYLDEVEKNIKSNVLERISEIRFGKEGYIFVNKFDGTQLITNGIIVEENRNLKNIEGIDGEALLSLEKDAAQTIGGDFIEYEFVKMGRDKLSPKISFIKGIPDWEWIIGAGF